MSTDANVALVVLVVAPLLVVWFVALFHIVLRRPDLSVLRKGIWSAVVILAGYLGLLLYMAFRPPRPTTPIGADDAAAAALEHLSELVERHNVGSIGDEEYAHAKATVFGLEATAT